MYHERYLKTGHISYLYKGVLTRDECNRLIKIANNEGQSDTTTAIIRGGLKGQVRLKFEDHNLTRHLYSKIKSQFESRVGGEYRATDTMITYVDYHDGGECPLHCDSKVNQGRGKADYITVIIYLNNFDGGKTYMHGNGRLLSISATMGDILVFHGTQIPHGCDPVCGPSKKILIFGIESV